MKNNAVHLPETKSCSSLTVITTPHITRLTSVAKETVKSDALDAMPHIERYNAVIDEFLETIDRRDLVMGSWRNVKTASKPSAHHKTNEKDRAKRVERSAFWDALETMGQRLDYIIENNDRETQKKAAAERTRTEWEELERDYVGYPPTVEEDQEHPTYCAAWNCYKEITPKGRRRSKYCSEKCRHEQKAAKERLKKTGTYLPVKAYEGIRSAYSDAEYAVRTVSLSAAAYVGVDGRNYRKPDRRELTVSEMTQMEIDRAKSQPGEVVTYNLADVGYYVDERGRYHISSHRQAAA